MPEPYFVITSEGGTVSSNEIQVDGSGVEIASRWTGGGLPPVTAQFDEGLGDGATYRGTRVQSRVLDFAAHCYGPSRTHLRAILDRLSMVLAHRCTVTFVDPDVDETWSVSAVRVGGGDYNYGEDGDAGTSYVNIAWSMQSESPFWKAVPLTRVADDLTYVLETQNYGTMPVAGIWRCTGPTNGFTVTGTDGEVLEFTGFIPEGQTVTVDGVNGTVTDSDGGNRYHELSGSPVFTIPVGEYEYDFDWDQSSLTFTEYLTRTNHVINSSLVLDPATNGAWTIPTGFTWGSAAQVIQMRNYADRGTARVKLEYDLTGLTVGKDYQVRIDLNQRVGSTGLTPIQNGFLRILNAASATVANVAVAPDVVSGYYQLDREVVLDFTATETSHTVKFQPVTTDTLHGDGTKRYWEGTRADGTASATIRKMSVAEPGIYFDGNTPDTATVVYSFTGAADASKSTEVTTYTTEEPIEGAGLALEVEYSPQRWLVI